MKASSMRTVAAKLVTPSPIDGRITREATDAERNLRESAKKVSLMGTGNQKEGR
jgi:hypothetical protein